MLLITCTNLSEAPTLDLILIWLNRFEVAKKIKIRTGAVQARRGNFPGTSHAVDASHYRVSF